MKKIIIVIVLIILAIIAYSSLSNDTDDNKNKNMIENTNNVTSTSSNPFLIKSDLLKTGNYTVKPSDISVSWSGKKVILKNWIDKGVISAKEISFDIKDGKVESNKIVIDMTTIKGLSTGANMGEDKLTTHLKSADWFDVEKFPISTFTINTFENASNTNEFIAKGNLTIKDITKEISMKVKISKDSSGKIILDGSADIDRTLWDIKYGSGKFFDDLKDNVVDDIFNISFKINLEMMK